MSKKILFFDVETTGKILDMKAPVSDVDQYPRITQIAWILIGEHGGECRQFSTHIKPDGWEIPNEPFFTENGMSTEICEQYGIPIKEALEMFIVAEKQCDIRVAHNMTFDSRIIRAELFRLYGEDAPDFGSRKICTMMKSNSWCNIRTSTNRLKFPSLIELHEKLFGVKPATSHDALADVRTCMDCFDALVNRSIISLEPEPEKVSLKDEFKDM